TRPVPDLPPRFVPVTGSQDILTLVTSRFFSLRGLTEERAIIKVSGESAPARHRIPVPSAFAFYVSFCPEIRCTLQTSGTERAFYRNPRCSCHPGQRQQFMGSPADTAAQSR